LITFLGKRRNPFFGNGQSIAPVSFDKLLRGVVDFYVGDHSGLHCR
jgi:hypothetical protein